MSKTILWQYNDFNKSRKEKLVNMLISEIIFLKTKIINAQNYTEIKELEIALNKLEYLLKKLKETGSNLPETYFDKIIMLIHGIFKNIAEKLEANIQK
ncbi:MAG: hypothetical protein ACFFEY_19715 [Candidatus Thorarchaeota archaeon]